MGLAQDPKRIIINEATVELVGRLAKEVGMCREAVADFAFLYLQRTYRNPTNKQKNASFNHWKGICQCPQCKEAGEPVARADAVFHHLQRRIAEQHEPHNLLPYHRRHHDLAHRVRHSSLSKGSPGAT
ncbi:MAG TPA: hypothetical protein VJA16_18650 [Thermoanaerobaculia bacterium]